MDKENDDHIYRAWRKFEAYQVPVTEEAEYRMMQIWNAYKAGWLEALEQQEVGDAEIKQMLNDIEYYQKRVEALEQRDLYSEIKEGFDALKQPAQEPVAWYGKDTAFSNGNKIFVFNNKDDANAYGLRKSVSIEPLYTHPAPSWQGLSDDEIEEIVGEDVDVMYSGDYEAYRAIEQALKEKNHGNVGI